jgi:plasmid stabilization system protein ParE
VKLLWSAQARDELAGIAEYISESSEAVARRWITRLRSQAKRAVRFPKSGRVVPEIGREDLREIVFRGYRIVYLLRDDAVLVVSVFEGHRELRLADAIAAASTLPSDLA